MDQGTEVGEADVTVHVYGFFEQASAFAAMRGRVDEALGHRLSDADVVEQVDVRDVAPKKHMLRLSFRVPPAVLRRPRSRPSPSAAKRPKLDVEPL